MGCSGSKPTTVATQPQGSVPSSFKKKERPPEVQAAMDRLQDEMADVKDRAIAWAAQNPDSWWVAHGGTELEPLAHVLSLVDAKWLLGFAKGEHMPKLEGVVPALQRRPAASFVNIEKLRAGADFRGLPLGIISYGWAAKHQCALGLRALPITTCARACPAEALLCHLAERGAFRACVCALCLVYRCSPDPTGEQLASLVPVLQLIVAHFYDDQNSAFGLGWDFMSLPQYGNTSETPLEKGHDGDDRTPEQLAQFALALGTINVWYGHPRTLTIVHNVAMPASALNQTEYGRRGWCIFELTISSIIKDNTCFIEVSKFGTSAVEDWGALILRCRARRPAPVAPDVFRTMMIEGTEREAAVPGSGIRFTSGKDLTEIVIPQYKEGFVRLFGQSLKLVYATLAWGDNEAAALSAALAYAGRVGALDKCESISLDGNMITDIGAGDLITMLRDKTVKTPRLQRFTCYGNRFSSVCKAQIKEAARERSIATVGV